MQIRIKDGLKLNLSYAMFPIILISYNKRTETTETNYHDGIVNDYYLPILLINPPLEFYVGNYMFHSALTCISR